MDGFGYDLLEEIAAQEDWDLEYSSMDIGDIIVYLKENKDPDISVLSFLAYTDSRESFLDYTDNSILDLCGILITQSRDQLNNIQDLNQRKLAVIGRGVPSLFLAEKLRLFGIECDFVEFENYTEILDYVIKHPDAIGLVDNYTFAYYQSINPNYEKLETVMLLLPSTSMRFCVRRGLDTDILTTINRYFDKWEETIDSPFAKVYQKWHTFTRPTPDLLSILLRTEFLIIPILIIALILWVILLRYRVRVNTLKIKTKEQDMHETLMSIGDGVIAVNLDCTTTNINPVALRLLTIDSGSDAMNFNACSDLMLLDRDTHKPLPNPILKIIEDKGIMAQSNTCLLQNKLGKEYIITYTASPIRVMNTLKGVVFVFKDITEEATNAEKIIRSERKLSAILESINEAIIVFDPEHQLKMINDFGIAMLSPGSSKQKLMRLKYSELICPEFTDCGYCPFINTVKFKSTNIAIKTSRSGKIYRIKTTPLLNNQGEIENIIESALDITELKHKEKALKISENNYRMLIENQSDIIIKLNAQNTILFITNSCSAFFNLSSADLLKHSFFEFIIPEDHPVANNALATLSGSLNTIGTELRHQTPSGIRWISWQLTKVLKGDGSLDYLIATGRDITESKLASEQLQHMQKLEAIGQLAGGVAHDFNNMLGGIVGFAELISMQSLEDSTVKQYCKQIIDTSERASELTQQLLSFARKGKASSTPIDAHSSIRRAISILNRSINKNISIELFLNASNSTISGDPSQIQNIILNLGINARDAIGEGNKGVFTIETSTVHLNSEYCKTNNFTITPGEYIRITARDTGCGMDQETLKHIFEPFFTTKDIGKGTGLGLASIFGAITSHSGAISVNSEPGKGTEFFIYLPVLKNTLTTENPESPLTISALETNKEKDLILVIDDEEIIRMVAKSLLENSGFEVLLAVNGKEGIELFIQNQQKVSAVILDVIMPHKDGKETLLDLLTIDNKAKIIMASGYANAENEDDFIRLGAKAFIHKPYRQKELYTTLGEILRNTDKKL